MHCRDPLFRKLSILIDVIFTKGDLIINNSLERKSSILIPVHFSKVQIMKLNFLHFLASYFLFVASEEANGMDWKTVDTFKLPPEIHFQKAQEKLKKHECAVSATLDCLQWRCQKLLEFQNSEKNSEKDKLDIFYVCANWISMNIFLEGWSITPIR